MKYVQKITVQIAALVQIAFASAAAAQDYCEGALLYENSASSSEFCAYVSETWSQGHIPIIQLPIADDDCPDDGDPTLECDPTLRLIPNRPFTGIVSVGPGTTSAFEIDPGIGAVLNEILGDTGSPDSTVRTIDREDLNGVSPEMLETLGQAYPWAMPRQGGSIARALVFQGVSND